MRKKIPLISFVVLAVLVALFFILKKGFGPGQPIAFNHKAHAGDLGLECVHCHTGVEKGPFATLPGISICLECHETQVSENPEEAKVRNYSEANPIPWHQLTRQPDHVYFSHQRHVTMAEITCERCHGRMQERTRPPGQVPVDLTMDDCLECHQKNGVSGDCILCHR